VASCKNLAKAVGNNCEATVTAQEFNNGSSDPDGDPITFALDPAEPFAVGTHNVTLTVTDSNGASSSCTATLTVVDQTPPAITGASVDKPTLWPPNHQMVDVTVSYMARDNCGPVNTALSISSNEPVNGGGDGNTTPDWEIVDTHHVRLRAERSGQGNGRIYTIRITATDSQGNTSNQTVSVSVPHN
jgi:hypothetical protein